MAENTKAKHYYHRKSNSGRRSNNSLNTTLIRNRLIICGAALMSITVIFLIIFGIYKLIPKLQDTKDRAIYSVNYEDIIDRYSKEYNLDKAFVCGLIHCESSFDADAESGVGAKGLMQMTDETFDWMQERDSGYVSMSPDELFTPEISIKYGCMFLDLLFDVYDSEELVLCAYNAGMGNTDDWLETYSDGYGGLSYIPFPETESYVYNVTEARDNYKELYGF
ncbi:MAG: lytic transglycosylase domain-containing protein [Clostridia bacterium]|nr:lytic transglycosylase domain-containing protein [Clostridia bacterium]